MVDVHERLRGLREAPAPDLWPEVERRDPREGPSASPWQRAGAVAAALIVAAAGFAIVGRAFLTERAPTSSSSSPQGTIAYAVHRAGEERIYVTNADGSARPTSLVEGRTPEWSPDGSRIAFRRDNPNKGGGLPTRIYISDADGGDVIVHEPDVAGEASGEGGPPMWSPDGSWITFDTLGGIYVMRPDGTGLRKVTEYRGDRACYDLEPSWRPDGEGLAFAVLCDGGNEGIWTVALDGTRRRPVLLPSATLESVSYPVWSPDGNQIAFVGASGGPDYTSDLFVMSADGTGVTRVTQDGTYWGRPAWSPDGRWLAIGDYADERLWIVAADGSRMEALPESHGACCPSWTHPRRNGDHAGLAELELSASADVGGHALDVAYGAGAVWTLIDPVGGGPTVHRIDPMSGQVTGSVRVPPRAYRLEVGGEGVWVIHWLDEEPDRLTRIDPGTLEITVEMPLAEYVGPTSATEDALWAAAAVGETASQTLLKVDVATNVIERSVPLEGTIEFVDDMSFAGDSLWLLDYRGLAKGPTPAQVVRVDAATGEILAEIPVEGACHGPGGLRIAADIGGAWINCRTGPESFVARRIDGETNSVSASVDLPAGYSAPFSVARDGVWFVGYDTSDRGRVFLFDPTQPRIMGELILDGLFGEVAAVDSTTGSVWVARAPDQVVRLEFR